MRQPVIGVPPLHSALLMSHWVQLTVRALPLRLAAEVGDRQGDRDGVDFAGVAPEAAALVVAGADAQDVPEVVGNADRAVGNQ